MICKIVHGHNWGEKQQKLRNLGPYSWTCLNCGFVCPFVVNDPDKSFNMFHEIEDDFYRFKLSCNEYLTQNILEQ